MNESDEYCPHCDNHFVLEAVTPKPSLQVEGEDTRVDNRYVFIDPVECGVQASEAEANNGVECSKMIACGRNKKSRFSTSRISRIGWVRCCCCC